MEVCQCVNATPISTSNISMYIECSMFKSYLDSTVNSLYSFVMQGSGLSSRINVVIGILITISGGILLTDWQALPSDHCIEYSPFHHPELREKYASEAVNVFSPMNHDAIQRSTTQTSSGEIAYNKIQANVCFPRSYVDISNFNVSDTMLKCTEVDSCVNCLTEDVTAAFPVPSVPCFSLDYRADKLCTTGDGYIPLRGPTTTYLCNIESSKYCACVIIPRNSTTSPLNDSESIVLQEPSLDQSVHIQTLQLIEESVYNVAVNKCESLHDTHGCHWIPQSKITGKLCGDCQPICRSVYHTLTFIQFCIGTILLQISLPSSRVSAVNILTDVVHKDIQVRSNIIYIVQWSYIG